MKIVTDSSGRNYVEISGQTYVDGRPPAEIDSTNSVVLMPSTAGIYGASDPYALARMFELRGAMWDERSYGFSSYRPPEIPSPPPKPPNRFQHLDWEEGVA